jgi:Plavaka transposase
MNDQEHRSRVQRLFHESMRIVLEPLLDAGRNGIEMTSSDGAVRHVHPILTCYVADYPEQCLVTCSKYGTCPKCRASSKNLEDPLLTEKRTQQWTETIIKEGKNQANGNPQKLHTYCMSFDIAGTVYRPFWEGFPLCDINSSITPDVLHQLYQGVFKHLVGWCQNILTPQELDRCLRALPPASGLRQFKNGIFSLSQISGTERKNMAKILLGCLVVHMPLKGISAVTALLDFIYTVQYSTHDSITLGYVQDALDRFHKNRDYFIATLVREDFNIPKFHSLLHYIESIENFGTTDNYNTEMFERLHIDFAKHGWRASNQRDEFPQMIRWLSRQEKIMSFETHQKVNQSEITSQGSPKKKKSLISIAKYPNFPNRQLSLIEDRHKAPDFTYYLKVFLMTFTTKKIQHRRLNESDLPFKQVDVYNMFRFHPEGIQDTDEENDLVKALPLSAQNPDGHFDTVVAIVGNEAESTGLAG